jgi:hypothetical protein
LDGHLMQSSESAYVSHTRPTDHLHVHLAREDLGEGTDEQRLHRYAQRLGGSPQRWASIHYRRDTRATVGPRVPARRPVPEPEPARGERPPEPARAERPVEPVRGEHPAEPISGERPSAPARRPRRPAREDREPVELPDFLAPYRTLLGPQRTQQLAEMADELADKVAELPTARLAALRARIPDTYQQLDRAGARRALTLEHEQANAAAREREAREHAAALRADADQLPGIRRRNQREDLLDESAVQDRIAEQAHHQHARHTAAQDRLRETGRHPDTWMDEHAPTTARTIAIDRELAIRHELHPEQTQQPPAPTPEPQRDTDLDIGYEP